MALEATLLAVGSSIAAPLLAVLRVAFPPLLVLLPLTLNRSTELLEAGRVFLALLRFAPLSNLSCLASMLQALQPLCFALLQLSSRFSGSTQVFAAMAVPLESFHALCPFELGFARPSAILVTGNPMPHRQMVLHHALLPLGLGFARPSAILLTRVLTPDDDPLGLLRFRLGCLSALLGVGLWVLVTKKARFPLLGAPLGNFRTLGFLVLGRRYSTVATVRVVATFFASSGCPSQSLLCRI
jgi:hypothetical protein